MKKILSLVIVMAMLMLCFISCTSEKDGETAMYLENGGKLSINYMYLLSSIQKKMYAGVAAGTDGDWDYIVDKETGKTLSDLLYEVIIRSAESSLVCEYLHDEVYSLTLTDEQKKSVDTQIEALEKKAGSKQLLEEKLSLYSADTKTLRRYFEISLKQVNLLNYFYGENGLYGISEDEIRAYFEDNYAIVTHIYFNLSTKPKGDGTLVSLTDEEIAQKRALAQDVYNRIMAGESFEELKKQYSEDTYEAEYFPNGFFVTNDTSFPTGFTTGAMSMRVGEYRFAESGDEVNGIHILYRLPMKGELYNTNEGVYMSIKNQLISLGFDEKIAEYLKDIVIYDEVMNKLNVKVIPEFE